MNTFLRRINRKMSLRSAAVLIAASMAVGFILGFIRTKLIYANFNDFSTGAYFVAFEIPDLIFYTFSAGALSVAFIPVLSDRVFTANMKQAWQLTSAVLNSLSLVMLVVSLLLILFPRPIVGVIADGFSPERLDVTAQIMRLAAINPLVFSITSVFSSIQQVFGRFFYFAVAPLFYNLAIIASIYLFKDSMGVVGLGAGVAIGSLANILILGLGMNKLSFKHSWLFGWKDRAFLQVIKALPARSLDQGIVYVNSIVQTNIASGLPLQAAIPNLKGALILYHAPINLLGMALGTAVFPRFTKHLTQNRPDRFKEEFLTVLKAVIWLAIPVVIFSFVSREYWARIIFSRENSEIALIFGWLCLGIVFRTMYAIVSRFYYAQKDILTPLTVTVLSLIANIILSWLLAAHYGVEGLGMATSLVAILEIIILLLVMHRRDRSLFHARFFRDVGLILMIGAAVGLTAILAAGWWPLESEDSSLNFSFKLGLIFCLTFAAHFAASRLLGINESQQFWNYVRRLIRWDKWPFIGGKV